MLKEILSEFKELNNVMVEHLLTLKSIKVCLSKIVMVNAIVTLDSSVAVQSANLVNHVVNTPIKDHVKILDYHFRE